MKSKVLVIGGSGFIGSHVADNLSTLNYKTYIYDLKPSKWLKSDQEFISAKNVDYNSLEKIISKIDVIYYFAGISDIKEAKIDPLQTLNSNVINLVKFLEIIKNFKSKRFVYASTMYVHSDKGSFYSASKKSAEIFINTYAEEYGIEYTLLRYGSIYGPRSQGWNGIKKFARQILRDDVFEYGGDGSEMREYIHVTDAARLSVEILKKKYINSALTITGQQLFNVDQLASILFEIAGKKKKVKFNSLSDKNDHYGKTPYRLDFKKSMKLVPTEFVDLGQGLLEVMEEVIDELKKENSKI